MSAPPDKKKKRKPKKLPVLLKSDEADLLLAAACGAVNEAPTPKKEWCARRDFVMIQTGLLAGPRVSELCHLTVENIDLDGATLSIIEGKGSKDRNVSIGKKLLSVLREWIGERTTGWLFPGPNDKRLLPRTLQRRLITLAKKAGIRKAVHPHLMRHSYACSLLRAGANIKEIQELLGHANLQTTMIYLHTDTSHLKEIADRL